MLFINGFNRISGLSRTGLTFRAARFNEWINARFAFASAHELSESGMGEAAATAPFKLPIYTISSGQFLCTLCTNNISSNVYALNLFD